MSPHWADWAALDLIAVTAGGLAVYWALQGFRAGVHDPARDETTQYSSMQDD